MFVLDRTGSMCEDSNGNDQHPTCPDMANAKSGMMAFLGEMDSSIDRVGLTVFPPAASVSKRCKCTRRRDRTTTLQHAVGGRT